MLKHLTHLTIRHNDYKGVGSVVLFMDILQHLHQLESLDYSIMHFTDEEATQQVYESLIEDQHISSRVKTLGLYTFQIRKVLD
jgi:hypothetical protein